MNCATRIAIIMTLATIGLWQLGSGLYIHAKAWLAQALIESAWDSTLAGEREVRPWPWADTWPVARLRIPDAEVDLYVLADASGRSLAFGPGYWNGSAAPGSVGNTIIAAHRDTHFSFLRLATPGQEMFLQTLDGREHRYRLMETRVLDSRRDRILIECRSADAHVAHVLSVRHRVARRAAALRCNCRSGANPKRVLTRLHGLSTSHSTTPWEK